MPDSPQTVKQILEASAGFLERRKIAEARPSCELLLSRLLNCRRLDLHSLADKTLSEKQVEAMRRGLKRLSDGEPVQYIIGRVEFMDHQFKTDSRALIPRPETELLVEEAIKLKNSWLIPEHCLVLDVGTGSGCIIISLASSVTGPVFIGTDISSDAIALAEENAAAIQPGSQVHFHHGTLDDLMEPQTVSLIISNPPYIRTSDYEKLPHHIRNFEPKSALDGGPSGTAVIEEIVHDASALLRPGGHILLEIGFDQANTVKSILSGFGFEQVTVKKDYAGHDRIAHAVIV